MLFEADNRGHTEHFAPLRLTHGAPDVPRGAIRRVRAATATTDGLVAALPHERGGGALAWPCATGSDACAAANRTRQRRRNRVPPSNNRPSRPVPRRLPWPLTTSRRLPRPRPRRPLHLLRRRRPWWHRRQPRRPRRPPKAPRPSAPAPLAAEAPPPQPSGGGGWLSRLRGGLQRTTARLTESVTALFRKRRLDDEALEELEETLIAADLGLPAAPAHRGRLPPHPLRQGGHGRGGEGGARRGDRRDPRNPSPSPMEVRPERAPACGAGGRRQRHRQDHHHRQARPAIPRAGPFLRLRRRRHLPRRRRGAAPDLGRAHRLPRPRAAPSPAPTPPASPSTRSAPPRKPARRCSWSTPPAASTTRRR